MLRVSLAALLILPGCPAEQAQCVRARDCPTGEVCADGVCTPEVVIEDLGEPDTTPDLGADQQQPDLPAVDGPACVPDNNDRIERSELLLSVPSKVAVTIGGGFSVDLAGTDVGGVTYWDLTGAAPDDSAGELTIDHVPAWAAASFPQASYASQLQASFGFFTKVDLLGVFELGPSALRLIGGASDVASHTRLDYAAPLEMLRFPLAAGDSFKTSTTVTGFTEFTVPVWLNESYAIDVIAAGRLKLLPSFTLDALLVRAQQEVYPLANPLLVTKTVVFLFLSECYGTVARVVAETDPGSDLKSVPAKERWKLAAP